MTDLIKPNEYPAGQYYTAIDAGPVVEFWDAETMIFQVPAAAANSQASRDALAQVYDAGVESGRASGRHHLQFELRQILGAASK